ncbi:MAG: hypothetical protein JXR48_15955 [Candidatus Delongbacteria bacterium]|nr:hypothetical protein [Candidatus Delongbacteria bacterium]MBN2836452.1 hypothetical protein [Candidatus Delongbacteria bacterium]
MQIRKLTNTDQIKDTNQTKKTEVKSGSFKELLNGYISELKEERIINSESNLVNKVNLFESDNFNVFNLLKINHLEDRNENEIIVDRKAKLENVRKRVNEGYYNNDSVLYETAGNILDELDINL